MNALLLIGLAWVLLGVAAALALGRAVRLADRRATTAPWTDEVEQFLRLQAETQRSWAGPDAPAA